MEKIGVEAIVKGLNSFLGDMGKMDKAVGGFGQSATLLQKTLSGLGNFISGVFQSGLRILEYTLGNLLAGAIRKVIDFVGELISATIEAGSEFQKLDLRLQRLNINELVSSGMSYVDATKQAIEVTKEQLDWLQKLAVTTPYDNTDIANIFTLARSYGFAGKAAQDMTEDITNFSSGMGLGNVEMDRIIVNFGQMVQLGKVTQRELNDLARGSFVPVNDVLKIMQKETGKSGDEFEEFLKTVEGVDAFMKAFSTLVEERFAGAAIAMARTFEGASNNAKDLVKSIFGLNVVRPVLDVVGGKIADLINAFTENGRWEKVVGIAKEFGIVLSDIVSKVLNFGDAGSFADKIIDQFALVVDWVKTHETDILNFFGGIGEVIKSVRDWIEESVIPAFNKIYDWTTENGPLIKEFFTTLGDIVSEVFQSITSQPGKPAGEGGILESITKFMQFVVDNKDEITKWVKMLWSVFIVWQVLSTIFNIVVGVMTFLITTVLGLAAAWLVLAPVVAAIVSGLGALLPIIAPIILAIGVFIVWLKIMQFNLTILKATVLSFVESVRVGMQVFLLVVSTTIGKVMAAFYNNDWAGVGKAIIDGIIIGIGTMVGVLVTAARNAALAAFNAAKKALGIKSPSTLFMEIGEFSMKGMAQGIDKFAGLANAAMSNAASQMAMSAMIMPQATNNSYQTNNNFNLQVNSNAQKEPVIQDFNMMQSLVGG